MRHLAPHNPIGKVFSEEELLEIGKLAKEKNFLILSDEVVSQHPGGLA